MKKSTYKAGGGDERAAFLESIRRAIADGTYRVNSRVVAEKLLDALFPPADKIH